MKRFTKSSQQKISMHYKKGVPSKINSEFQSHRVDSAFISSIKAKKYDNVDVGIIAKKEVLSVLVIPNKESINDIESASSNMLAKVLDIQGEVLIGDKALKYYLEGKPHIDLAKEWHSRYNLPFVFALLCFHKERKLYKRIEKQYLKLKPKIPQYILEQASQKTAISKKDILHYLHYISYDLNQKSKLSLKKFYKLSQNS